MSISTILFETGRARTLHGLAAKVVTPLAVAIALGVLYGSLDSSVDLLELTIVFLGAILVLTFLLITPTHIADPNRIPWYDLGFALLAMAVGVYLTITKDTISTRIALLDELTNIDMLFGSILLFLMVEVSRRTTGLGLTVLVLAFFAYDLWGDMIPGALGHGQISYEHFLDLVAYTTDGIFGAPLRVCATFAFLFVLFGVILNKAGGGDFFFNMAARATGRATGGPAKVAVVSSGLYGMISGNPVADCVTTGAVTIPAMKRLGYPSTQAAGIEVAASAGGSLAPPVMGAVAFIMAEMTGIPYAEIAVAAVLPALLYYLGIFVQVHLSAKRYGLRGLNPDEIPTIGRSLATGWPFVIPLVVLVGCIVIGYSAGLTALYALAALILVLPFATPMPSGSGRFQRHLLRLLKDLYDSLAEATVNMVPVAAACASAGLIVGAMTMTGLAAKFADVVVAMTGQDLFASLVVAALVTTILGLGLPTSTSYILAAVLTAPVLLKLGASLISAHMFILYYAVLSGVSPPIAVAAYAAAAIAKDNPFAISIQASRFCIVAFLVPFSFAFNEALFLRGDIFSIAWALVTAVVGVIIVGIAVEGFLDRPVAALHRLLFLVGGLLCFGPGVAYLAPGLAIAAIAYALHRFKYGGAAAA